MNRSHNALASTLLVAMIACGGDSLEPEGQLCTAQTGSLRVIVDHTRAAPVFTWSPHCDVASLLVEGDIEGDVWFIESSPQANVISWPITYGTTSLPAGVQTVMVADPLVPGRSYDLILFRVVDPAVTTCPDLLLPTMTLCRVVRRFTWSGGLLGD